MKQADDYVVVRQVERDRLVRRFQRVGVVGEQHQRGESRRADGVALGHRLGGIADRIERIGDRAHFLRQVRHFGDAAGVVGDRAVGVERDDDAGHRQHRGRGDRDAVESGEPVGGKNTRAHGKHRQRSCLHRHAEAGDDVGGVAGRGCRGDVTHRRELGRGVVLGDHHHQRRQHQADYRRPEQLHRAQLRILRADVAQQQPGHRNEQDRRDHPRRDHALVQRHHDLSGRAAP